MNYDAMKLPDLKALAKERKIKGYSHLNKADLVQMLQANDSPTLGTAPKRESFIDGIKAAYANMREARSNRGRRAGQDAKISARMSAERKTQNYLNQRSGVSPCMTLTARQARRVRKAENYLLGG